MDGKKVAAKTLHPAELVPSGDTELVLSAKTGTRGGPPILRMQLGPDDFKQLNTVEGRQDLELTAIGYVASLLLDNYASPGLRLQAAKMVLPPRQLTAEELQQRRDLDEEIFQLTDQMAREAEEMPDWLAFELLSPETRDRVIAELAAQDIELVDEEVAS